MNSLKFLKVFKKNWI